LSDRADIVASGALEEVPVARIEALAKSLLPGPARVDPSLDPTEIPRDLAAAVGERRPELERAWVRLSGLERYTLAKLARPGRLDEKARRARLLAAVEEIVMKQTEHLSHLTEQGHAHMVEVGDKAQTERLAVAAAFVRMRPETVTLLTSGQAPKGDVLATARIAGIQAAKRTPELIPLCHSIALTGVEVDLEPTADPPGVRVTATARAFDRTGVEMEALVAASIASLTLYDMLKSADRGMVVENVRLERKSGGRSGDFEREAGDAKR
jgi:cyclic pyranopterin phosphate synthase